uniref:Uncharacterized protein n=1 Tax=Lymantria dispar multicapsid nuclear polyhedrosis virus TaxID=10449 RepID=A0A7S8IXC8_NPVLD|nr:hypothetical protein [Lymantria dispar multiple nucleopolyhedrovirus]QPD02022.1 hypothetical protein [Lymantria dispar multiple nucleopolyhedrovirus]
MEKKRPSSSIRAKLGAAVKRTSAHGVKKQKTRDAAKVAEALDALDDLDVSLAASAAYSYPHDVSAYSSAYSYAGSPHIDYSNMEMAIAEPEPDPRAPPPPAPAPAPAPARYHRAPAEPCARQSTDARVRFVAVPALNFSAPGAFGVRALQRNMDKLGDYLNGLSGKKLALAAHFDESRAHSSRSLDFLHYVRRLLRYDASEKNLKLFIDMSNEYYFKLIEHAHALVEILVNVSYSRKSTRAARRLTSFVNLCAAHALGPMLARLEGGARASAVAGAGERDEDEEDDEPTISYAKRLNRSLYFLLNKKLLQLNEFVFYKYTHDNDRGAARDDDRGASRASTTRTLKIFDVDVEVVQIDINLHY